jgi:SDR family mycofactocin-dependent oxidoreductase
MSGFKDKVAVITGGAKGQGRSHALAFARAGASVVICDIARQIPCASPMGSLQDMAETKAMVEQLGAKCLTVQADTRSGEEMRALVETTVEAFGQVDVFVANAGIAAFGPVKTMEYDVWRDVVDIDLTGVATSIRAVLPAMVGQGHGRIVATSSAVGREGGPNNANYAAAKWGVIGFVKSVAIEVAPHGVTVNAISPMSVATDMCHNEATYRLFRPDLPEPSADDVRSTFAGLNPMGVPWLDVADSSAAVLFLCSDEARYITGVALDVGAGWNAYHGA